MGHPEKMVIHAKKNLHSRKVSWTKELAISQPLFELQTHDFALKFIWTVQTNNEKKLAREANKWQPLSASY